MARLPQVSTNALPGVRQNIRVNKDMFGGNMAKDLGGVADAASSIQKGLEKRQEKIDAADAFDAEIKLSEKAIEIENEIRNSKGLDAEGAAQKADELWAKHGEEVLGSTKSERSRLLAKQSLERTRVRTKAFAADYERQEIDSALETNYKTGLATDIELAVRGGNEASIAESEMQMRKKIDFMAAHKGHDQAWADLEFSKARDVMHTKAMDVNREDRPEVAMAHLNKFKDSMSPETYAAYHADLDKRVTKKAAMTFADAAIRQGKSIAEIEEMASGFKDLEKRDLFMKEAMGRYAESNRIKAEKTSAMTGDLNKQAYKDGLGSITDRQLDDLAVVDADSAMRYRKSRDEYNRIQAAGGDYAPVSDSRVLADVSRMVSDGDIRTTSDLITYRPYLDKGDWSHLISKMDEQTKVTDTKLMQSYKMYLDDDKRNHNKWTPEEWANYTAFEKEARAGVKENSSPEHVNKTAAAWFLKGKIKDSGVFGTNFWSDETTQGKAVVGGKADRFEPTEDLPVNPLTLPGIRAEVKTIERNSQAAKPTIVRTGILDGKKAVMYSDGSVDYAD